jgi:hypothetical protein
VEARGARRAGDAMMPAAVTLAASQKQEPLSSPTPLPSPYLESGSESLTSLLENGKAVLNWLSEIFFISKRVCAGFEHSSWLGEFSLQGGYVGHV